MKRFWFGAALLAVLLGLGIAATLGMAWICDPISHRLDEAADAVQDGQWEQALTMADSARVHWEQWRSISAAVTNHEPMEEVDALFEALEIFARQRDTVRFADCCARLSALTAAISESQAIYWWNIL